MGAALAELAAGAIVCVVVLVADLRNAISFSSVIGGVVLLVAGTIGWFAAGRHRLHQEAWSACRT